MEQIKRKSLETYIVLISNNNSYLFIFPGQLKRIFAWTQNKCHTCHFTTIQMFVNQLWKRNIHLKTKLAH